ncbi:GNAT family N-acetyltransferase [Bifidobacterium aquikefiri]|uniref:GNAT family N-acetyltransferase n=1 Tax=Bifidobacterium aquikefiri TaxID=1653207 RepID=UPI0023F2BCDB|nr:GNAT family N-acetyltransferase [Bifidobacterium aquikefiri]
MFELKSVKVREARSEDVMAIHELNLQALNYDYPLDSTRDRLESILRKPNCVILVACHDGQVIGYVQGDILEASYTAPMVKIEALAVNADQRHLGVGRLLMRSVEQWARQQGVDDILLNSGEERTEAHRFYSAIGYERGKKEVHFTKHMQSN